MAAPELATHEDPGRGDLSSPKPEAEGAPPPLSARQDTAAGTPSQQRQGRPQHATSSDARDATASSPPPPRLPGYSQPSPNAEPSLLESQSAEAGRGRGPAHEAAGNQVEAATPSEASGDSVPLGTGALRSHSHSEAGFLADDRDTSPAGVPQGPEETHGVRVMAGESPGEPPRDSGIREASEGGSQPSGGSQPTGGSQRSPDFWAARVVAERGREWLDSGDGGAPGEDVLLQSALGTPPMDLHLVCKFGGRERVRPHARTHTCKGGGLQIGGRHRSWWQSQSTFPNARSWQYIPCHVCIHVCVLRAGGADTSADEEKACLGGVSCGKDRNGEEKGIAMLLN